MNTRKKGITIIESDNDSDIYAEEEAEYIMSTNESDETSETSEETDETSESNKKGAKGGKGAEEGKGAKGRKGAKGGKGAKAVKKPKGRRMSKDEKKKDEISENYESSTDEAEDIEEGFYVFDNKDDENQAKNGSKMIKLLGQRYTPEMTARQCLALQSRI